LGTSFRGRLGLKATAINSITRLTPDLDSPSGNCRSHYRLVLSAGHDEYSSSRMRDRLEACIRESGNVAFFTAGDTCCWQVIVAKSRGGATHTAGNRLTHFDHFRHSDQRFCSAHSGVTISQVGLKTS
jgi:hypothetical protein